MRPPLRVILISTYELGRQPFGLASPAAWLRRAGAQVNCSDLAVERLDEEAVRAADLVAFHLPMHTATRIATRVAARVRALNPRAHLCFYGLYASMNEPYLRGLGAGTVLGGEFEAGLLSLAQRLNAPSAPGVPIPQLEPLVSLDRQRFLVPDRTGMEPLSSYAALHTGNGRTRTVGYTEASRGCKHLCRHCPIPPVYGGTFRVVQRDVVLEDIRRQVAAGAEHITFGDPDFFNGVGHARALVQALHREHPHLTYDVTIKVEHLLRHARELPILRETGCLLVTTAAESVDDHVLEILDKGHTRDDFVRIVGVCREAGLVLNPTFVAFTPWISLEGYQDLLALLAELDLIDQVAPVQLALRLLIPAGSKLLELAEVREMARAFDSEALVHPWRHGDPRVDRLQAEVQALVREATVCGEDRREIFSRVWRLADRRTGDSSSGDPERVVSSNSDPCAAAAPAFDRGDGPPRASIPYLTEPWYC